jgi:hypothetical protein
VLVIKTGNGPTGHAIVAVAAGTSPGANYGSNIASLALPSSQATGLGATTASVTASGWNPATETEVFGVEVMDGGSPATSVELLPRLTAINSGDSYVPASSGVVAAATSVPFGAPYNMTLTFAGGIPGGVGSVDDLGIDLSSTNDPLLSGFTFDAVAVVPEPMSLSILALGGMAFLARRGRRKN